MDGNSEFGQLMQQAAALKSEQVKADRRKYEKAPSFLQHTLFHCVDEAIEGMRDEPDVNVRLEFAKKLKEEGNELFNKYNYMDANDKYERAIGCFWFIETTERDWKNKGIKDEYLTFRTFELENEEVKKFVSSCLNNVAMVYMKMGMWSDCIIACEHAIELDPTNIKAYFRSAKARTSSPSSGAVELDLAIKDLKKALKVDPTDKALRRFYYELSGLKTKQKSLDQQTFTGMFERGELVPPSENKNKENVTNIENTTGQAEQEQNVEKQLDFYKDMSVQLKMKGRDKDAAEIDRVIEDTQAKLRMQKEMKNATPPGDVDYFNPTPEMIQDAKEKHNLDLTDPMVQKELARLTKLKKQNPDKELSEIIQEQEEVEAKLAPSKQQSSNTNFIIAVAVAISILSILANNMFGG